MLQSVRDKIITAFVNALESDKWPVYRSRTNPLHRDDSIPSIVVTPIQEQVAAADHESQERHLSLKVVCFYGDVGIDDESIDQKVEALTSWVESRIQVDETFGGLANESTMSEWVWHIDAVDEDYIGAEGLLQIKYFTARNAPDVPLGA